VVVLLRRAAVELEMVAAGPFRELVGSRQVVVLLRRAGAELEAVAAMQPLVALWLAALWLAALWLAAQRSLRAEALPLAEPTPTEAWPTREGLPWLAAVEKAARTPTLLVELPPWVARRPGCQTHQQAWVLYPLAATSMQVARASCTVDSRGGAVNSSHWWRSARFDVGDQLPVRQHRDWPFRSPAARGKTERPRDPRPWFFGRTGRAFQFQLPSAANALPKVERVCPFERTQ
jgi:hypothetical protein